MVRGPGSGVLSRSRHLFTILRTIDSGLLTPIRLTTLLFAGGIVLAKWLQISPLVIPFICVSGFLGIFIFIAWGFLMPKRFISLHGLWTSCILYAVSLIGGGCLYAIHASRSPMDISLRAPYGKPIAVAGEITGVSYKHSYIELQLNTHRLYSDTLSTRVQGSLLVRTQGVFTAGMHVLLNGEMNAAPGKSNPGDFDYGAYLAQLQIHALLDAEQWTELGPEAPLNSRVRRLLFDVRLEIQEWIRVAVPRDETHALLLALILGDQSQVSRATLSDFRSAGISHLLAVSGLHVLCVGLILYGLLRPLCLRMGLRWRSMECIRIAATLLLMGGYLCLTDFKPAVFRATVMTSIFIIAPLFQRPVSSINNLAVAGLVLLIINPGYLFQPGFQLSFTAVAGIMYVYPRLHMPKVPSKRWGPTVRFVLSSTYVSLAALIGTIPVSLYHFESASPGGLLLNIVAIPITTGVLVSGLLMIVSSPLSPGIAGIFGASADVFAQCLFFVAKQGAVYFPALSVVPLPYLGQLCILLGGLMCLVVLLEVRLRWSSLCTLLSILLLFQWGAIARGDHHPQLDVLFFDVGHGDAALVTFPNGRHMLIDAGDIPWKPGASVLLKHLERYPIGCIDAVVLTHPDRDHIGGLHAFHDQQCINTIYTSGDNRYPKGFLGNYRADTLSAGDAIGVDERVLVRVLSPPPDLINRENRNDGSIVLLIQYGETRFLFLGDAEAAAEAHLVTHFPNLLASEVIKVGHHGSRTSSSLELVQNAAVETTSYALISTGPSSRYGLPDEDVVARWERAGVRVHNTAEWGALWISSDGTEVKEK